MGLKSDSHFYYVQLDLEHHRTAVMLVIVLCGWTSAWLIVRLWMNHRLDSVLKRLAWSLVLLVPVFGWVAYGAFYVPLPPNTVKAEGRRYGE